MSTKPRDRQLEPAVPDDSKGGATASSVVLVIALVAFLGLVISLLVGRSEARSGLETVKTFERYEATVNGRDWAELERLLGPNLRFHNAIDGSVQTRRGFLAWARLIGDTYPQFGFVIDHAAIDGDVATARFHERDRTLEDTVVTGTVALRVIHGQIVELWSNYDEFGLLHERHG